MDIEKRLHQLKTQFQKDLKSVKSARELEVLKIQYLGKKGELQGLMSLLRECTSDERPKVGKLINELKNDVTESLAIQETKLDDAELTERLKTETDDITLPGRRRFMGRRHIISQTLEESLDILMGMGFSVQYGPDIESEYYNFEALNFAKDHPARDMQDTFFITKDTLLRTHTSNIQIRVMEGNKPPIRVVAPGICYRNEDITARSHVMFHQIEALYVDKKVTFGDLLSTLEEFYTKLFKSELKLRYRPSYFPFVEPGMEVDVSCIRCSGEGCVLCKQSGWLEVCGAGMVHPEVLKSGGIDPEEYTGFAFGGGVERVALLRHAISDIRLFLEDDLRFLGQF
ncbi:MAG: Phenylalanine--tRNA ligase alpha subunit [Chlamydiae bacterium]|nr:Phenylalanine--tRNA ligase alpha subunit [Chlamydiota bacterium]